MMSVRRRLLLLLLPALAILMLAGAFVDYLIATATTRNAYDRALASGGQAMLASLRAQDGRLVFSPPRSAAARPTGDADLYAIIGPDGALLAGTSTLPVGAPREVGAPASFADARFQGRPIRVATMRRDTPLGPVTITVAETAQARLRAERVMLYGKLLVDFAELDVILILVWIAVYQGLRPLQRLREQVEMRTPRDLQHFEESRVPDEVRPLVKAFNRLLELLHDAANSQRRFVADAAHQMRTPIAGIMAQLELLLQNRAAATAVPELVTIHRGIHQLAHSANQLLALARAEPLSTLPDQFTSVPLQPLVEELVERHIDRADNAGLDLGAEAQVAEVAGNAWLLDDLVSNLIDNALKYTPRGGHVTVRCGILGGSPYVEVEDDGPGIPESERSRVRERFYRRPGAPGTGCGLGLAIVDEIARVHRAIFSIDSATGGAGTCMRVKFPHV